MTNESSEMGHVKLVCGTKYDYLAMIQDYLVQDKLKIKMKYYIDAIIEKFPYKMKMVKSTPWNDKLFKVNKYAKNQMTKERLSYAVIIMKKHVTKLLKAHNNDENLSIRVVIAALGMLD